MTQQNQAEGNLEVAILEDAPQTNGSEETLTDTQLPAIAEMEEGAKSDQTEAYLTTVFNHEARQFDRAEAEELVQIGLYSKPHVDRLKYLARLSGEQGVKELLNSLIAKGEQALTDDIMSKVTDPEFAQKIADEQLAKLREALPDDEVSQSVALDKEGINRRLAEEFIQLQSEFPQVQDFGRLPQWVKECSARDGVPLKYAYALHACREQAQISVAEGNERRAAEHSAGSLKSNPSDGTSPEMASVYKALWGQY